jgi:hypothetical protein
MGCVRGAFFSLAKSRDRVVYSHATMRIAAVLSGSHRVRISQSPVLTESGSHRVRFSQSPVRSQSSSLTVRRGSIPRRVDRVVHRLRLSRHAPELPNSPACGLHSGLLEWPSAAESRLTSGSSSIVRSIREPNRSGRRRQFQLHDFSRRTIQIYGNSSIRNCQPPTGRA